MRKQSKEDQEKRLRDLRCPVHGLDLSQIDVDIVECSRRDCRIRFKLLDNHTVVKAEMPDSRVLTVACEWPTSGDICGT